MTEMNLKALFEDYPHSPPETDVAVSGISVDSRLTKPGDVFVATSDRKDGHVFIPHALENGAAAVVGTKPLAEIEPLSVPYFQVEDARGALAYISEVFYDFPARELSLIGVTGSDGKTSTVNMLYQILKAAGIKSGMVSTVNAVIGEQELDTGLHVTTPEVFEVQQFLRQMVDAGLTHAVLETTSHGLAARRVFGKDFDIGVVTNITHEHLDYHGTYDAYLGAKALLFEGLFEPKHKRNLITPLAVLNFDDRSYHSLTERTQADKVSYGLSPDADVWASEILNTPEYLSFKLNGPDFEFEIQTRMIGNYNVANILAAITAAIIGLGISPEDAKAGIEALESIPGRMERISLGQDFITIVDFAHTPYALESVLSSARGMTEGRVIAAFGSAGLRDKEKRRMMAEIAVEMADLSILTAEDPRSESLDEILAEMAAGALDKGGVEGETFFRIPDRGEAIRFAIRQARPGDLVYILGKGHEQSMCFGENEYPWDDRIATQAALAEILGSAGPTMPVLPTSK
ncbi:MAG: UDP-N-acetylmuramoyl-L-alanyl-D-glutamate--2,6-diaminopimelate ligase [Chloroflexota bacterium]